MAIVHKHSKVVCGARVHCTCAHIDAHTGCNYPPVLDLERWAKETSCGSQPDGGSDDVQQQLFVHVAWSGTWPKPNYEPDVEGLFDSFLLTQDTRHTKLIFWLMDAVPDPALPIIKRYKAQTNAIEFRKADLQDLSKGTCLEGRDSAWNFTGKIPLQSKSDLLRLLLLWRFGGRCLRARASVSLCVCGLACDVAWCVCVCVCVCVCACASLSRSLSLSLSV